MMGRSKFFLKSTSVLSSLGAIGLSIVAMASSAETLESLKGCAVAFGRHDIAANIAVVAPVIAMILNIFALNGRVKASQQLHTPGWLPGPSKGDFR